MNTVYIDIVSEKSCQYIYETDTEDRYRTASYSLSMTTTTLRKIVTGVEFPKEVNVYKLKAVGSAIKCHVTWLAFLKENSNLFGNSKL